MKIETERLLLREFDEGDLDALAPLLADEEVMRFSIKGPIKEKVQQEIYLKEALSDYNTHGFGIYAVVHKDDQSIIGSIGLLSQNIDNENKVELTYRLAPKYWGQGLATEATKAVCQHAVNALNITELISIIDPKNSRSIAVSKRLGMNFWKREVFHTIAVEIYSLKLEKSISK